MTASAPSGARYGVTSMVAPLQRVLLRRPALTGDWEGAGWRTPDPRLERQHGPSSSCSTASASRSRSRDALEGQVDAVYMHDPLILSGHGGIPLNMAKPARTREPGHAAQALAAAGVPVMGTLEGDAYADGGDRFWLDDTDGGSASATGPTARAPQRVQELLVPEGIHVEAYDMPHDQGPGTCCTCSRSCAPPPRPVRRLRAARPGAPAAGHPGARDRVHRDRPDSYVAMGCNILAVRPGVVVMVDGVPAVREALERGASKSTPTTAAISAPERRRGADVPDGPPAARKLKGSDPLSKGA